MSQPSAAPLLRLRDEDRKETTQDAKMLLRLWPFAKLHRWTFAAAFVLMPLVSYLSLLQPLLLKRTIDAATLHKSAEKVTEASLMFLGVLLAEFVFRFGQTYLMQLAGQRTLAELRKHVFRHVHRLSMAYFDRTPIGRIVTRMTNDVDSLGELFASGAVTAIADIVTLIGIVAFMLSLDVELALVSFALMPPLFLLIEVFRKFARNAYREIRVRIAELNAYLSEQVQGVTVVQAFGREADCLREYEQINREYREANVNSVRYDALLYSVVESVATATIALVLYWAAVSTGAVDQGAPAVGYIGTVVAFYEYIQRFFVPIRDLSSKYTIIQSSLAASERIFGLLDVQEWDAVGKDSVATAPPTGAPAIAFEDVTFAYKEGHPVLRDVSLRVARGQTMALVGPTGSGKSTITGLMLRLYEAQEGVIRLDGQDVRTMQRGALRRQFAVVPQDCFLFSGSILSNVALGDDAPDRARAEQCLKRVGAWDLIERRGGLDTPVGERGGNFSVGERQLVAFARALYRDPPLVILDEATASVDSDTESRLQTAVEEVLRGRTCIVVAHRLSTIRRADTIVVLDRGSIAERGTHEDLVALGGIYATLVRLQLGHA